MEEKKNSKGLILIIIIMIVLLLGLVGYVVYDKVLNNNEKNNSNTTTTIKNNNEITYKSIEPIDESNWKELSIGSSNSKTKYAAIFRGYKDEKLNYEDYSDSQYIRIIDDDYIGYDDMSNQYKLDELNFDILYTFKCDDDCRGDGYGNYLRVISENKYYLINITTKKGIELDKNFDLLQYDNKLYSIIYPDFEREMIFDDLNGNVVKVKADKLTQNRSFNSNDSYMYSLGHIPIDNKIINFRTNKVVKEFEGSNVFARDLSFYNEDLRGYKLSIYDGEQQYSNGRIVFVNENYEEMVRTPEYYYGVFDKNVVFLEKDDDNYFYKYDLENNSLSKSNKYNKVFKSEMLSSMSKIAYFLVNDNNELKIIDDNENLDLQINNGLKPENIDTTVLFTDVLRIFTNNIYECEEVCECVDYYDYDIKAKKLSDKKISNSCEN